MTFTLKDTAWLIVLVAMGAMMVRQQDQISAYRVQQDKQFTWVIRYIDDGRCDYAESQIHDDGALWQQAHNLIADLYERVTELEHAAPAENLPRGEPGSPLPGSAPVNPAPVAPVESQPSMGGAR